MSGPRKEWYVNLNTRREIPYLLVSNHVFFCFLNIHVLTFDIVFDNFPKISDHFHKISEDSQKDFWGLETNVSSHFPKISKAFQRFSKITGDRQRFPSMIQWWFVHITTHLSAILRDFKDAHKGHRFSKEKTLQIKKFLAKINNTSKNKSSPAYCKQKRNCKKYMHTASKRITHCKQNSSTLQSKELHAANKTSAHCKQKNHMLQTKLPHTANKTPACCKQKNYILQTKLLDTTNKSRSTGAQDDVKDWDLVSWFLWFITWESFHGERFTQVSQKLKPLQFIFKKRLSKLVSILIT